MSLSARPQSATTTTTVVRLVAGARLTARTGKSKLQAAFTALLLLVAGCTAWRPAGTDLAH
jgi:uncharacterized membrane protein YfcA